ncbi:hypothetical protein C8F04DRAFT_1270212 [Mycena alexandri]|uniref:CxC2-like cysteine cluster KDZ transposase-associated domain-containing protein n=1 Tax=Mycena alexandri TaxID=1745969 RepID=A0AAD6SAY5_9AGAR|nr:hypothetical protein C8F04DRAFT_1270212 [Mycena alexandri]
MAPTSKPKFSVETTRFSDSSDSEAEDDLPRMEPMRNNETVRTGGRVRHTTSYVPIEVSPGKRHRDRSPIPDDLLYPDIAPEPLEVPDWGNYTPVVGEDGFTFDDGHPVDKGPRALRKSDRPLEVWAEDDLEAFADEILRGDGRGDYYDQARCAHCKVPSVQAHRCENCFTDALFCGPCLVLLHADNPFHTWDGNCFVENTLENLGLRVQLGHKRGEVCPGTVARTEEDWKKARKETFCIVDDKVIHEVGLDFCTCGKARPRATQLLRAKLYPTTTSRPSSAATFRVLRRFHKLSFESKCSAYEFYNALARETNNTGNFQPRNRYSEFLRMTRERRHLMILKRMGRIHLLNGVRKIAAGACALLCPACPQPGKNLPVDGAWKDAPPEKSDVQGYMEHVGKHWEMEQEKSRCVSHDAVNQPDREARGTASSGIGTVDCARHNMKRPNGVGDLQKGERYINMDYMLWKSLQGYDDLVQLVVSYDIVCQWRINIWTRLANYKRDLRQCARSGRRWYVWLIPKFHLPAHIEACNILYSFNLTPYIGQTDGEAPERGWANANPLAASTKEMGPGGRRDTLDDHFNDWNHKKIIALGRVMLERIQKAVGQMVEREQELLETEASLPAEIVKSWATAMELWESDSTKPNPFNVGEKHATLQAIRGRIAEETKDAVEGDAAGDVRGELHASEMVAMGMQLEQQQRELACDIAALKNHASDSQKTTVLERGNKLRRKIASWIATQTSFQSNVADLRREEDEARTRAARMQPSAGVPVHALELWLPSRQARTPGAELKLTHVRFEFDMREGRAHEALDDLRNLLLLRTHHYKFKDGGGASGVAGKTRLRSGIEVLDERLRRMADDYRASYRALASLGPKLQETRWYLVLKPLAPEDVRGMPRGLFSDPEKKKKKRKRGAPEQPPPPPKEMSWIWRTGVSSLAAAASTSEEAAIKATNESLRVEWAKTRARARRWTEEVNLLEEEMRRILVFLEWRANWWRGLKENRPDVAERAEMKEGFDAYAERQARVQEMMKSRFEDNWKDVPRWIEMGRQGVLDIQAQGVVEGGDEDMAKDEEDQAEETDDDADEPVPLLARNTVAVSSSLVEGSLLPGT